MPRRTGPSLYDVRAKRKLREHVIEKVKKRRADRKRHYEEELTNDSERQL